MALLLQLLLLLQVNTYDSFKAAFVVYERCNDLLYYNFNRTL